MTVILSLHYPKTGIVQSQEYPTIHQAITIAHGHFASFPEGYAQITDKDSQQVVMANEELRGTFETSRKRDEVPAETPAETLPPEQQPGFFSRLFGGRSSDTQPN